MLKFLSQNGSRRVRFEKKHTYVFIEISIIRVLRDFNRAVFLFFTFTTVRDSLRIFMTFVSHAYWVTAVFLF